MALTVVQPRTYLQLCQDLYREVGAAGGAPNVAIPSTVGVTGEILRLVNYVHDAELEIQNLWVDWKWLRQTLLAFTIPGSNVGIVTAAGGGTNAQPPDLAEWDWKTFFIYPAGQVAGNITSATIAQQLPAYEWNQVKGEVFDLYDQDQPWRVIVMNDNTLRFDLTPDQSYQIQAEYRTEPYDLKNDSDVSNIPPRFANRIIIEWARFKYALFENAAEQVQYARSQIYGILDDQGIKQTQGLLAELENDQLPNARQGRLQSGNNIVIGEYEYHDDRYGFGYGGG